MSGAPHQPIPRESARAASISVRPRPWGLLTDPCGGAPLPAARRVTILAVVRARYDIGVRRCEECGGRLPRAYSSQGRPRVYCSGACRQRAYRRRGGVASGTTGAERRRREQARLPAEAGSGALRNLAGCCRRASGDWLACDTIPDPPPVTSRPSGHPAAFTS
jgi:hypothetical protein